MITTDILIIGAGPSGLFAVFEAGLLKMRCHLIDALPQVGGQLGVTYPKKLIYDVPGFPKIVAKDLIQNLQQQIAPFKPGLTLGERVEHLEQRPDGKFQVTTNKGTVFTATVVVIAGGLGSFEPKKPRIRQLADFEGKGVDYWVTNPEKYRNQRIVISGGGDLALEWAIRLTDVAKSVTLVHRRKGFRNKSVEVEQVEALAAAGKINLSLVSQITALHGSERLENMRIKHKQQGEVSIPADYFISLLGVTPQLGPINTWGLNFNRSAIPVNPATFETNLKGIFAIGDMSHYEGKMRLILCGFYEATLMAQAAFEVVFPNKKRVFRYTTTTGVVGL